MQQTGSNYGNFWNIDFLGTISDCFSKITESERNLNRLNIMIIGKSGVGKSTLVNNLFRNDLAKTGGVKPVTKNINRYSLPNYPLTIYDSQGFELNKNTQKNIKKPITDTVSKCLKSGKTDDAIHCILYCIHADSTRFEQEEIRFISELTNESFALRVPVIVVLTQAYSKNYTQQLHSYISGLNLNIAAVVDVLAEPYFFGGGQVIDRYGLDTLTSEINKTLNHDLLKTFANVQKASAELKINQCANIIKASVTEAGAAAMTPLPVADSVILIGIETKMLAEITTVFGTSPSKSFISMFLSTSLGTTGATVGGRALVSALKLVPGVGSLSAGMINASVAMAITAAMGNAYTQIMLMIFRGELSAEEMETQSGMNKLFELIDEQFVKQKNRLNF